MERVKPEVVQRWDDPDENSNHGEPEVEIYKALRAQRSGAMITFNAECLDCGAVEKEMVRVGALHFCLVCFEKNFDTRDPVREERKSYLEWLATYKSKY